MFLDCPEQASGEWKFRFAGVPVRVQPAFWITILLMGPREPGLAMIWAAVCFASILAHEMGHATAMRAFGETPEVVLYGCGGVARALGRARSNPIVRILILAAGPGAGFAIAALTLLFASLWGVPVSFPFGWIGLFPWRVEAAWQPWSWSSYYGDALVRNLLYVNVVWGLMNLLPIYPLDGGQIARCVSEIREGAGERWRAARLSAIVAVLAALAGFLSGSIYLVFLFGVLAAGSLQQWEQERPRFRPVRRSG